MEQSTAIGKLHLSKLKDFARAVAAHLAAGDVLLLSGPIGAGKTTLTKEIVAALGSAGQVTSPTFAIAHFHESPSCAIIHVDAYRLSGVNEYLDLDLEGHAPDAIRLVEWGDGLTSLFPHFMRIHIECIAGCDDVRLVGLDFQGGRWAAHAERIRNDTTGAIT